MVVNGDKDTGGGPALIAKTGGVVGAASATPASAATAASADGIDSGFGRRHK